MLCLPICSSLGDYAVQGAPGDRRVCEGNGVDCAVGIARSQSTLSRASAPAACVRDERGGRGLP